MATEDQGQIAVIPLTFHEQIAVQAYTDAIKSALAAATDANTALVTAAFSLAAAYGALIGLVSPTNSRPSIVIASPFLLFGAAFVFALFGRVGGIDVTFEPEVRTQDVEARLHQAVARQRMWSKCAAGALALAVVVAGIIVSLTYGHKPKTQQLIVRATISASVTSELTPLCPGVQSVLVGVVSTSASDPEAIELVPGRGQPCAGRTLLLPASGVVALVVR